MFIKRIYSSKEGNTEAIPEMVSKLAKFRVPEYSRWALADQHIIGKRTSEMFDYIRFASGKELPDYKDVHRWVVSLMGRGYAGISGIVDHWALLRPSSVWFDREVRQQQDFFFKRDDGGEAKIWQLGNNISHYYFPFYNGKSYVHSYTFLEIQVPGDEVKKWRDGVKSESTPQVNHIRYPIFVLDHEFLKLLDKHQVLDKFEVAINRLTQTFSHDFAHHYVFPSVDEARVDPELNRLVRSLCLNIELGRQQKNIETIAIMLNLGSYLHSKEQNAENAFSVAKIFMNVRDELCGKLGDDKREIEAVRNVFNSIAVLLVSGFVQKEDLLKNVDGDIADWRDLLQNPKHIYTPEKPMFVGYKDPEAAAALIKKEHAVPKEDIIYQAPAEIAATMILRYAALAKSHCKE